jgi:PAS domain S-box-containing protein
VAPLAVFLLVATAIAAASAFSYARSAADLRHQEERELATIASLKAREVVRWRDERIADASAVARDLEAELARGADPSRALAHWHEALRSHREYPAVAFVPAEGDQRLVEGAGFPELSDPSMVERVRRVAASGRGALSPFHLHPQDPELHLDVVAPVARPDGRLAGGVVLRVDPKRQFFTMLRSWAKPWDSAEIMLVRAESGTALVVNDLREEGAMTVRVPLDRADDVGVKAVSGARGAVLALDHRGVPVLAGVAPVPESPWTLVAKVDEREALSTLPTLRLWTTVVAAALALAAGAGAALWWRTQASAFERGQAVIEAERRVLAHKLENLTRFVNDVVMLADADSRIVEANDRAVKTFGYSREELMGMPVRELRDPATVGDVEERIREQVERGAAMFETRYRRKDGSTFPAEVSVHVDEYGGRRYFQAIIRDVSARERAAEALRASEAKFRAAFEFASLGVVLVSPDGAIVETNRAFRRMLGYAEEEMRGMSLTDVHEPGDELAPSILRQMVDGSRDVVELPRRFRRKDGSSAETILRATALRDDTGTCRFALGVVEDVSERKQLEAQLVLADRMASIGTLAAGVAHEINNPLSFILSNLDFALRELREAGGDPELERALQDAMDGGVRVREIVRDLRTFSRSDSDEREALDVRSVLQSAIGLAANEVRHRAELAVDPGEVPRVLGSEHRLGQVFLNLLVNAAQAIPEAGPASRHVVRASTSTAPDGWAVIEISDTGAGIPGDVLPRIFDPFFTTKPVGVGTGLGLSICHAIVVQHGGTITVESTPGQGTTFRVRLPPAAEASSTREEPRAKATQATSGPAGRVLVVDDEPLVGRAVARMLAPLHEVVACTSAQAALRLLAQDRAFDVVLCDLMMPGMTGMQLHAELEAKDPPLARRMVFLTGGAFTDAGREFLERVENARVEKPFERAALREAVFRAMSATRAAATAT